MGQGVVGEGDGAALAELAGDQQRLAVVQRHDHLARGRGGVVHVAGHRHEVPRQPGGERRGPGRLPLGERVGVAALADPHHRGEFVVGLEAIGLDHDQAGAVFDLRHDRLLRLRLEMGVPVEARQDDQVILVLLEIVCQPGVGLLGCGDRAVAAVQLLGPERGPELDVGQVEVQALLEFHDLPGSEVVAEDDGLERPAGQRGRPVHMRAGDGVAQFVPGQGQLLLFPEPHALFHRLALVGEPHPTAAEGPLDIIEHLRAARNLAAQHIAARRQVLEIDLLLGGVAGRYRQRTHLFPLTVRQAPQAQQRVGGFGLRVRELELHGGGGRVFRIQVDRADHLVHHAVHARQALEGQQAQVRLQRLSGLQRNPVEAPLMGRRGFAGPGPVVEELEILVVHRGGQTSAIGGADSSPAARGVPQPGVADRHALAGFESELLHALLGGGEVRVAQAGDAQEVVEPQAVGVIGLGRGLVLELVVRAHDRAAPGECDALSEGGEGHHPAGAIH